MNYKVKEDTQKDINIYKRVYRTPFEFESNVVAYEQSFPSRIAYIRYFKSGWGNEYREVCEQVNKIFCLSSIKGRSTSEYNTYFEVILENEEVHTFHILYSGNWKMELIQDENTYSIWVGYSDDFRINSNENDSFETYEVAYLMEANRDTRAVKWQSYVQANMLENEISRSLPVVYNHWWAYEDQAINEKVFLENLEIASQIGIEAMVLDAGWFGDCHWFDIRGDWDCVDVAKFPNGIRYLSNKVHEKRMKFGFWIEIEGVGIRSQLYKAHPQWIAKRDGITLEYLCFGYKEVIEWALDTLRRIIIQYDCDWIKFDFNLDPQLGCNCEYHNHGKQDGLDAHVKGIYSFFKQLHSEFPEVVFENCSSGGQRSDLKLLSHFHCNFLSDPDNVSHKHRCIQNASYYMPANKQFHFMPSQTCGDLLTRPFHNTDLENCTILERKIVTRLGMLTFFGVSHRLPHYSQDVLDYLKSEIQFYKTYVRKFIQEGKIEAYQKNGCFLYKYKLDNEVLVFLFGNQNVVLDHELFNTTTSEWITDLDTFDKWQLSEHRKSEISGKEVRTYLIEV